jgi:hypothetical protein
MRELMTSLECACVRACSLSRFCYIGAFVRDVQGGYVIGCFYDPGVLFVMSQNVWVSHNIHDIHVLQ